MDNILEYILSAIFNIAFIAFIMQLFSLINVTPSNRKNGNILLSGIITLISILLVLEINFNYNSILYYDNFQNLYLLAAIIFGIFTATLIWITLQRKTNGYSYINLNADDYEIITQGPTVVGSFALPIFQDYPGITNYLSCKNGDIILLASPMISCNHDIECSVQKLHNRDNVYMCDNIKIIDNLTSTDKLNKVITVFMIINAAILAFMAPYIFMYIPLPYIEGIPKDDIIIHIAFASILGLIGSMFTKIKNLTELKFIGTVFTVFGYMMIIDSFINMIAAFFIII